ncbi:AraC family transcriptional regulator [Sphingomonas kyeonggiensis]|uniref:AraC family transcriptional regulator n=1 Tax=Sphingomonas kyeonggiensis TaxID=1268553 RepID=A0A7W7NRM6_9SPHN|nr:helix-turn-helix transcriptional regulator [Sphingomonas kyeonggiensis]MBB4839073.1 AraC family transcriptional regulator [Sphingomonas kyeonggiensis]
MSRTPLLVFNPPGTTHRDRFHEGQGSFLAISGGYEQGEGPAVRVLDPYAIWTAHAVAAQFDRSAPSPLAFDGRAHQLVATMQPLSSDEARNASKPPSWLKRVFEMTFTADDPELSVADLAAEAGVHPVHLARVFRRYLHCTPGEHLRGRRLERAAAMLGDGTASLAEVAYATGFVDQAHLSHAFRDAFRATPSRWRREVARIQDGGASASQSG